MSNSENLLTWIESAGQNRDPVAAHENIRKWKLGSSIWPRSTKGEKWTFASSNSLAQEGVNCQCKGDAARIKRCNTGVRRGFNLKTISYGFIRRYFIGPY
jgi:hypothetical protein